MPLLIATDGPLKGRRFPLQAHTLLGRSFDADIRIDDLMVTRRHCLISATPQGYTVEDLGSRNGTFVNDQRVAAPALLDHGDVLRIQDAVFRFLSMEETEASVQLVDVPEAEQATIVESIDVTAAAGGRKSPSTASTLDVLEKEHQRLQTVLEIGNAVSAHVDLDGLLNEITDSFFRVFPQVDRGFIMLSEEGGEALKPKVARYRDEKNTQTISVSKHIIDEAVKQRIAILSADAMHDTRFSKAGSVMDFEIRSMMCAPLMAAEELLGVIHLDTTRQDKCFTGEDLQLFTAVANQTALAISYARMHERLRRRQRIEHELALAHHVQHSFLPPGLPEIPGMRFGASYRAADEVGGDFYDFILRNDGRLGIVLGDVAGKGMPAALLMVRMMSEVRSLAVSESDPGKVLARLNEGLLNRGTEGAFVTMLFMVLDPSTRQVSIANAAHHPPVLRKGASGEALQLETDSGLPIGAEHGTEYPHRSITLDPGDCIISFTDGVTEAENAREEFYGLERLIKAITVPHLPAPALTEKLLEDISGFVGVTPQSDDMTILCFGATSLPA